MKPFSVIFRCLICFILGISASSLWSQAPRYLFVLDASGSMWQKQGTDYKISVAKSVMDNLINKLPDNAQVGLVSYGHNRKDDCADIETLVPIAPINRSSFSAKLKNIDPKGMTPIAGSIGHALQEAGKNETPLSIILISDGLETCEGNACQLVKDAKSKGFKITMHVVGFGISEQDISTLECIAQAGGGQYLPAENAVELAEALDKAIVLPAVNGGFLSVKIILEDKPVDAAIKIFQVGNPKEVMVGRTYTSSETNPRVFQLAPGEYRLEATAITLDGTPSQTVEKLVIVEKDTIESLLDFARGSFEILVTRNGQLSDALIKLYKAGSSELVTQSRSYNQATHNPVKLDVLPGLYDVEIVSIEVENKTVVRIENQVLDGGKQINLSHNFMSGEVAVGAKQGATLVDATVTIRRKNLEKSVASGRTYQAASTNPKIFVLEPGEYEITIKPVKPAGLAEKKYSATVKEAEKVTIAGEW